MPKKKERQLFGNNIMPSCSYCLYEASQGHCSAHRSIEADGECKYFIYEPTKREPRQEFNIKMFDYKLEDFKL